METDNTEAPQEENGLTIPERVQLRFEAEAFKNEVEEYRSDLRAEISEMRKPTFFELAGLYTEFAVKIAQLGVSQNPPGTFTRPDGFVAFIHVWLPIWITNDTVTEFYVSAPQRLH